jgi:hypothetical protein
MHATKAETPGIRLGGVRPARRARIRHPLHVHRQPRVDLFLLRPRDACRTRHRPCDGRR